MILELLTDKKFESCDDEIMLKDLYPKKPRELSEEEETLLIEVKNNGQRFPQNFDREKFITKYSTANSNSGSGLGGYDIHRIADYFGNPNWELILNQDPIYPVWFRFQFPIKIME